ncbi:unnamed protein product [Brachionus calyciflorus]|uniref:Uncharacterized protein n=1 Tax=Brachionus calyciflorus TaxID=104777 RepID=A0A813Y317_9BILA|nr:unnamed protein product [Brachionus calyciflorus]
MDSLFSLEVAVNFLKLNNLRNNDHSNPNPPVSCLFPCVAFRLLDYPTIAINLIDEYESNELKKRLEITQPFNFIEKLPCFTELLDVNGRYIFSKGKSCLFRSDLEILRSHLRHTPMYLMILDTFFEPHKLIGTVPVPLFNLIDEIYQETIETENNSVTPSARMNHGVMDIKNLMGENLGHISFVVRLTSFGKSLMPHIDRTTEAVRRKQKNIEPVKKIDEKKIEDESNEVYMYRLHTKTSESSTDTLKLNENALVQTVQIDYKDAQIQISELKPEKKEKFTQSPEPRRKFEAPKKNNDNFYTVKHEDEFVFNHYCPPPLQYNSEKPKQVEEKVTRIIEQKVFVSKRIEYLQNALEEEENIEESDPEKESLCDNLEIKYNFEKPKVKTDSPKFNLDQMPLLKCLFEEISNLKNIIENSDEKNVPKIQKNLVNNKTSSKIGQKSTKKIPNQKPILKQKTINSRERFLETVERLSEPKKLIKHQVKSQNSSLNQLDYDEIPVKGPDNLEIKKQSKKPLRYGLTNTHRLRVLKSRPNQVKDIEEKHELFTKEVKKNLDEINLSTIYSMDQSSEDKMQKNMEKILSDSLHKNTTKSNYSLLNRVEMESTLDTMNYLNTNLEQLNLINGNSSTKVVQFGNTYVYDAHSGGHSDESNVHKDESEKSNQNIFMDKKNSYENDFNSSLDSTLTSSKQSVTSTSNFISHNLNRVKKREEQSDIKSSLESKKYSNEFEDDSELGIEEQEEEKDEYHTGLLSKINPADLMRTSSKLSSRSYSKSFLDESFSTSNQDD